MKLLYWLINKKLTLQNYFKEFIYDSVDPPTPQLVAKRFRQLFIQHGVEETRIPRIFPKISLEDLQSDNLLIKKLTPELINEVAELFKVRLEWLEGVDDTIYYHQSCYKRPEKFFEFLKTIKYDEMGFPFRLITPVEKFDFKDSTHQPFSILFVEKIAELGDEDIHRYYLDAGWSWEEYPTRIQLKAMALLYWQHIKHPITLYRVPRDIYFEIENLQKIPYSHLTGALISNPSVEDYISDPKNSVVAKEFEELPAVLKYIHDHKLEEIYSCEPANEQEGKPEVKLDSQKKARKAAESKNRFGNELKQAFVKQYADLVRSKKISAAQASRDFYDALTEDQEKLLARSEKDYQNATRDETRLRGIRTLEAAIRKYYKLNP